MIWFWLDSNISNAGNIAARHLKAKENSADHMTCTV